MRPSYAVISAFRMILVILMSFYSACDAKTTRFLTTYTPAQDAVLGSNFTFKWKYELANGVSVESVRWILDPSSAANVLINVAGNGALVPNNAPASYSGRIKWTGDLSKFTASFLLMNIMSEDVNQYQIEIGFGPTANAIKDYVRLNVLEPAHFTGPPLLNQSLTEGQDLTLKCEARGKPQPNITWVDVSNGQVVKKGKGSSTLQINNISRPPGSAVSYVYECQAVNIYGRAAIKKKAWITVQYKAKIVIASSSTNTSSYIGQKITLTCAAEGVPVPTLEWIKPGRSPLKPGEQRYSIAVDVDLKTEADFGLYKCSAQNTLADDVLTIYINQQKKPGQPIVTFSDEDIQASSLTIKWSSPADDGGSAVTEYRVSVPEAGFDKTYPVSDTGKETAIIWSLTKNTSYTLLVYARNVVGEGQPANKSFTTKYKGPPEVVSATNYSTKDPHIFTIRWNEPISNGAEVEGYDIYKRESGTDEWVKVQTLHKDARSFKISLSPGASYQIVVTATNKFGESIKEKWVTIDIPPVSAATTPNVATTEGGTSGGGKSVGNKTGSGMIIGVAVGAVLFVIIAVALGFFLWRRRRHQDNKGHGRSSSRHIMDGPAVDKGAVAAGQRILLQNLGAGTERTYDEVCGSSPVYAQADTTKRMRNRSRGATPSRSNFATEAYENPGVILSNSGAQFSPSPSEYMPLAPSTRSWELKRSNINVIKIIGKGAFSKVGKATATGLRGVGGEVTVAVKMLKENTPDSDRRDLLAELELMKTFKPHPHVIKLLGCVTESEPPMVVIEYVPYGDLLGYLRKSRGLNDTYYKNPDVKPRTNLTSQQLMKFAWQIADGMSYLTSKKVIHRDLAARNVLVGEGEKCKVTDFGMARDVHQDDIYTKKSRGRLPVKWTAYESLLYGVYTTQSDVWSYGIVMYEIFTIGGRPYPNVDARRIAARLQEGYRMSKPAHLEDRLYSIMTDCWKENPSERPTFSELKGIMAKMERNHRTYINLGEYDGSLYVNLDDLSLPLRS